MPASPEHFARQNERPGGLSVAAMLALLAAAVALAVFAGTDARFRDAEGFISGKIVFPGSIAIAAIILAAAIFFHVGVAAAWLGLGLIAQAAALQLVEAGPTVGYQHYRPLSRMLEGHGAVFVAWILVQAVAVTGGFYSMRTILRDRVRRAGLMPWKILPVLIGMSLLSATFSRRPDAYAAELILASLIQLLALGNIVLFALALPDNTIGRARAYVATLLDSPCAESESVRGRRPEVFPLATAFAVFVVTSLLGFFAYDWHPHIPDEVSYLMQAEYFAEGKLYRAAPPVASAFDVDLMHIADGKWYSPFPPGWPLFLSLGIAAGFAWLVNPLLSAAAVLLAYRFLRDNLSAPAARLTTMLLALSPWFLFMGMSLMSHTLSFVLALLAAIGTSRFIQSGRTRWLLPAGVATGYLSFTRPMDGVVVAFAIGVVTLVSRSAIPRFRALALFAVTCGAVSSLVLPYNRALTGEAGTFPLTEYFDTHYSPGANDMGFGADRGLGWTGLDPLPGHGAADVFINSGMNAFSVNVELLGWATGSVVLLLAFLLSRRIKRFDSLMIVIIVAVAASYSLYWFSGGPDFGARYWFLMLLPCLVLTTRAIEALAESRGTTLASRADIVVTRSLVAVAALSVMATVTFLPWRAADKYHHYRGMRPGAQTLSSRDAGNSLVLVNGLRHPDYASAAPFNKEVPTAGAPVFAWARSRVVVDSLIAAFPDRTPLYVDGPTVSGGGFTLARDWGSNAPR